MAVVVITGASSGLGQALALAYAEPGVHLALIARRPLDEVARACQERGATVETQALDVTDREAMRAWLTQVDDRTPVDLVIANAGVSAGTAGEDDLRALFATNVEGVFNTVCPLIERFQARRAGQIAVMASLAGFRGFPGAPAYCASKAAIRVWGEGLRGRLAPDGIKVSVICPGFVRTPMTAVNPFPMPFLMDAERAARLIREGLKRNRGRLAFPWPMALAAWLLATLPDALTDRLTRKTPHKEGRGPGGRCPPGRELGGGGPQSSRRTDPHP